MWNEEKIIAYLKENLKEKRFIHSLDVSKTAVKLAEVYEVDKVKAKIAGLIHDCAKYMAGQGILDIMRKYGETIDEVVLKNPDLMHGVAGTYIAKNIMNIDDEDILNAVKYHTTGKVDMTLLEKIIYLADFIEPNRNFNGVDDIRKEAFVDLDKALIMCFDSTIKFVILKKGLLHINTIEARNFLLCKES